MFWYPQLLVCFIERRCVSVSVLQRARRPAHTQHSAFCSLRPDSKPSSSSSGAPCPASHSRWFGLGLFIALSFSFRRQLSQRPRLARSVMSRAPSVISPPNRSCAPATLLLSSFPRCQANGDPNPPPSSAVLQFLVHCGAFCLLPSSCASRPLFSLAALNYRCVTNSQILFLHQSPVPGRPPRLFNYSAV